MPHTPITRDDHFRTNEQASKAAHWMHEEMGRNDGVLLLDDAWNGVRERFGVDCAINGETDTWLSKAVLSAFRKLTPDTIWDPAGKRWRKQHRTDAVNEGGRMLSVKRRA